ncbi:hypothetical protein N6H18_07845 [Reichenbachiella agarivorans]|uniref:SpoIIAA-like n=1 Tax=Reichenbachiella agarivorans TaxID=2979464 RepID=A0ABY6CTM5_9BACT|nr:hypothetical protein [Reichenbachiella agarivorans]UXP33856.1 hypothetical protein N6H18_07845 [Reichenbachiella agarivorans]
MSVTSIPYKDITIIQTDLSGKSIDEGIDVLREAVEVISKYPANSVLSLINVTGLRFNSTYLNEIKMVGKKNAPFVKGTAAVGLTSMTKLIAKTMIQFTGRKAELFDDEESAKEWLYLVSKGER